MREPVIEKDAFQLHVSRWCLLLVPLMLAGPVGWGAWFILLAILLLLGNVLAAAADYFAMRPLRSWRAAVRGRRQVREHIARGDPQQRLLSRNGGTRGILRRPGPF